MMTKRQCEYTFRPADSLTQLVQLLAALVCLSQLLSWLLLAGTALPKALGWLEISDEVLDSLAGVAEFGAWVLIGLLLCSGLVFLCWLYRAACNARALGHRECR
ncbi:MULTISPECIES: hypothetical protein [Eikenella]|nr:MULTISPECIES: hypothetical protein [Eikenella]OFK89819.1 hypothetical protein HMPREF2796_02355 [Eikenella sp. HMSC071B05]OFO46521.1 hypothetical protein HMPREF3043_03560 [Eikenella sp. HMSC073A11]